LPQGFDAAVLAVAHARYLEMPAGELLAGLKTGGVVIDVKSVLNREHVAGLGFPLWRL